MLFGTGSSDEKPPKPLYAAIIFYPVGDADSDCAGCGTRVPNLCARVRSVLVGHVQKCRNQFGHAAHEKEHDDRRIENERSLKLQEARAFAVFVR